jgi:hypothetical protein
MGNPLGNRADGSLENESIMLSAFVALDGSSNVIGFKPTASPPSLVGPYSRILGAQKALGPAGAVITQPHTGTGVYVFTLDDPWYAGLEAWVQLVDQGAVAQINYGIDANVRNDQLGGAEPGCDPTLTAKTIRIRFRNNAGTLTDPVASTKFWFGMKLKRTGTP